MMATPCTACKGFRLKPEALAVKIAGCHIGHASELSVKNAVDWFNDLPNQLTPKQNEIATRILKEIRDRLTFLLDVGLEYLTLSRNSGTLSGGESQRIRLASQIGFMCWMSPPSACISATMPAFWRHCAACATSAIR